MTYARHLDENMFSKNLLDKYDGSLKAMIKNIEIPESSRILEVGCNESEMSIVLSNMGFEVWGVDVKPFWDAHGKLNFKFIQGNFQDVELPENYFDVVIDICAMHHFGLGNYGDKVDVDADIKTAEKTYKILKPDGLFYSSFDRYSTTYIPNDENICRRYSIIEFSNRICANRFQIYSVKYYKHLYDKEIETHEIRETIESDAQIMFVKSKKYK